MKCSHDKNNFLHHRGKSMLRVIHNVANGPDVDGYRVYDRIIVGHVSLCHEVDGNIPERITKNPGYFIIDLKTNRIYRGLSKQAWRECLRKYGVTNIPNLYKPSAIDKYLGHNKSQPHD